MNLPVLQEHGQPDRESTHESPLPKPYDTPRILLVDDNVDAANMLVMLLQVNGHTVTVKHDGEDALQHAANEAPKVLLIDIGMSGMDGYTLARKLRDLPQTANAVLIAVTGYGQAHDHVLSKAAGFYHHFVKPIDMLALTVILTQVVE